jgi:hypothetical protein
MFIEKIKDARNSIGEGSEITVGCNYPIRDMGLSSILCGGVIKWFETRDVPE